MSDYIGPKNIAVYLIAEATEATNLSERHWRAALDALKLNKDYLTYIHERNCCLCWQRRAIILRGDAAAVAEAEGEKHASLFRKKITH